MKAFGIVLSAKQLRQNEPFFGFKKDVTKYDRESGENHGEFRGDSEIADTLMKHFVPGGHVLVTVMSFKTFLYENHKYKMW